MYLYPNNLKGKPILWFWYMKDIVLIGITTLISVFIFIQFGFPHLLVISSLYAILTLRLGDTSILDFLLHSIAFFITQPQEFHWFKQKEFIEKERKEKNGNKK